MAAYQVLRGAQSRDACAGVASPRKQLRVVHVVAGRSCRLNSGKMVNTGRSGVGSMNVDKPAPTADGGSAAHIRGAAGTIIVALGLIVSRRSYTISSTPLALGFWVPLKANFERPFGST